ncbi:MAG TPA: exodeoxyribonuclease VII small subunit [Burkholderiaceae bacterium]|nr:exodeoxyribonuclease VII small subunit [Burkholderiaceae bacterium]
MATTSGIPFPGAPAPESRPGSGTPASFEAALHELEELVQRMEGGTLTLEQSMDAYRRGAELVRQCREALADVQQQVRVLEGELLQPLEMPDRPVDE